MFIFNRGGCVLGRRQFAVFRMVGMARCRRSSLARQPALAVHDRRLRHRLINYSLGKKTNPTNYRPPRPGGAAWIAARRGAVAVASNFLIKLLSCDQLGRWVIARAADNTAYQVADRIEPSSPALLRDVRKGRADRLVEPVGHSIEGGKAFRRQSNP